MINKKNLSIALWLIRAPFVLASRLSRLICRIFGAVALIGKDSIPCPACGDGISLVGRWECGWCSYVFDGFFFSPCQICGAMPPYIQCRRCGVGVRNPVPR